MASLPWARALNSISASSSGVSCSPPPPPPRCSPSWPSISPMSSSRSAMAWACSSVSAYSRPRSEKYTSKTVSNTRQCEAFFTSVAPRAYLKASRSSRGMCWMAAMASRFSVRLTGRPAVRSSTMKPDSSSVSAMPEPISARRRPVSSAVRGRGRSGPASPARRASSAAAAPSGEKAWWRPAVMPRSAPPLDDAGGSEPLPPAGASGIALPRLGAGARRRAAVQRGVLLQLLGRLGDVALVLEEDVGRAGGRGRVDLLHPQQQERARPVQRLGHRRRLLQLELADGAHDAGHLVGQALGDPRDLGQHDLPHAVEVGVVDVQAQAAPLERLGQRAGVDGGEDDERRLAGDDGAQLGDRHLVVRQDLEQERLGLDLVPVHLVDEQDHRVLGPDGLQQRAREEELVGEDVVLDFGPGGAVLALGLD